MTTHDEEMKALREDLDRSTRALERATRRSVEQVSTILDLKRRNNELEGWKLGHEEGNTRVRRELEAAIHLLVLASGALEDIRVRHNCIGEECQVCVQLIELERAGL